MRSFSYTPDASFSEEFLLHSSGYIWWGVPLTLLMLVLVRSFSYTPRAGFSEEFLWYSRYRLTRQLSPDMTSSVRLSFFLHSSCCLVRSFFYTPRAGFSQEFLLHPSSWFSESHEFLLHSLSLFKWGVSLTLLELVLVRSFSYTPRAGFSKRFPLHFWYQF